MPPPRADLGDSQPVDAKVFPAALSVELRSLGRIAQAGFQRPKRVRLCVVLCDVFITQLAERRHFPASDCRGVAAPERSDLLHLGIDKRACGRARVEPTLEPSEARLVVPAGTPSLPALDD
jgi:hypothetical protein